jgi:hypothetical protein
VNHYCKGCFEKQCKIDELTEEVKRLKAQLNYLERKGQEGYFGSSTPSSQVPLKNNSLKENQGKRGGAKPAIAVTVVGPLTDLARIEWFE